MLSNRKLTPIIGTLSKDCDSLFEAMRLSVERYEAVSLDCAPRYGNLEQVALAIRTLSLDRARMRVTSKINFARQERSTVDRSVCEDIASIGISYLDCYLIHSPRYRGYPSTWLDMLELQRSGLVKEIGVANFGFDELAKLPAPQPSVMQVSAMQYYSGCSPRPSSSLRVEVYGLISCFLGLPESSRMVFSSLCTRMGLKVDEGILMSSAYEGITPVLGTTKLDRLNRQFEAYGHGFEQSEQGAVLSECLRRTYA